MNLHASKILLAPRITEKGAYLAEAGCYVFDVAAGVNKAQIATAIRDLFKVAPRKVTLLAVPRKVRATRDTNRSGFIGLLLYRDGERRYALLPKSLRAGDTVEAGEGAHPKPGNRMALKDMPIGAFVYNVEIKPGNGGKLGRSAGTHIELIA